MLPLVLSQSCIVTSLGMGEEATLAALRAGVSGLRPCRFDGMSGVPTCVGEVAGVDEFRLPGALAGFDCRNNRLAAMALAQDGFGRAVASAREKYGPSRIGVVVGTSTSGILQTELAYRRRDPDSGALPADFDYARTHNTFSLGDFVRCALRLEGPAVVVSAACATTAKAFGNASRMIEAGLCDAAVVGGADSLCLTTLLGFHSLCLISTAPCRPFDTARDGLSIGEGAAFALLEKAAAAGGGDTVRLLGIGESSDAHHMSTPHPEGLGARLAMERALRSAGLPAAEIDYINLHGTATPVGDAAEARAVSDLFGMLTPCSSTKGQTGHTLGASGIIETIISTLGIRHGFMPGSPSTREVDPAFRCHYLTAAEDRPVDRAMSNSFGFGGSNCSIILGRSRR